MFCDSRKKEITVKAKVARKKSFIQEDKEDIQIQVFKQKDCDSDKKGKIYAKKAGNAKVYITQKAKGKKKKCKLKVKVVAKKNKPVVTVTTESTKQPTVDQTKQPTASQRTANGRADETANGRANETANGRANTVRKSGTAISK